MLCESGELLKIFIYSLLALIWYWDVFFSSRLSHDWQGDMEKEIEKGNGIVRGERYGTGGLTLRTASSTLCTAEISSPRRGHCRKHPVPR